jgi:hypothetical protein
VWRFISPSALVLALLTLPFPWLEVRCQPRGSPTPNLHYTQTGAQMLLNRSTRLDGRTTASGVVEMQARLVIIWLWLAAVLAALGAALAARDFAPALLNLLLSCVSLLLFVVLLVVVTIEELFNSVTFTAWPFVALLACFVAVGGSIATLVLRRRKPRWRHPEDDL